MEVASLPQKPQECCLIHHWLCLGHVPTPEHIASPEGGVPWLGFKGKQAWIKILTPLSPATVRPLASHFPTLSQFSPL